MITQPKREWMIDSMKLNSFGQMTGTITATYTP